MVVYALLAIARATAEYYAALVYCLATRCNIERVPLLQRDTAALVHVYGLARTLLLWHAPHYRAPTFADDLRANLRDVAIPCTGVPLSWFCACRPLAAAFLFLVNPAASLAGALYLAATGAPPSALPPSAAWAAHPRGSAARTAALYRELLLSPAHWLATWRLNCVLVAWHACCVGGALQGGHGASGSKGVIRGKGEYALEDKGSFLLAADRAGLPAAPFLRAPRVFVKHRGVEGGQGIRVYRNFTAGGDWVVSEALENAPCLARMLPPGAPLSTFRVVTASVAWLEEREAARGVGVGGGGADGCAALPGAGDEAPSLYNHNQQQQQQQVANGNSNGGSPPQPRAASRASTPGAGIRALLAGRRSRAGARPDSPPLPVSTSVVQRIAGGATPVPADGGSDAGAGSSDDDSIDGARGWHSPAASGGGGGGSSVSGGAVYERAIEVLASVFRAGLAGADTDHKSICFPVDEAGELGAGVTASHWYRVGPWRHLMRAPPQGAGEVFEAHPQSGFLIAGQVIPDWWQSVAGAALQAHALLAPGVPLCGWDVALAADDCGGGGGGGGIGGGGLGGRGGVVGVCGDGGVGVGGEGGIHANAAAASNAINHAGAASHHHHHHGGASGANAGACSYLLELNVSCNLFNACYDRDGYSDLVYAYFAELGRAEAEQREAKAAASAAKKKAR